ncbi:MAG TPA: methyltransferase domain-containing protein [Oculatellaceae cyanobacterium]
MIGPDAVNMRRFLYALVDWNAAESVLDLGCGIGSDLYEISQLTNPQTRLIGLDSSTSKIEQANRDPRKNEHVSFEVHDLALGLPFPDNSFDVVFMNNVLECIHDKNKFLGVINRALKPGGQFLCAHFDWDTQVINGFNKDLIRKIVHAFADWQQPWMQECDGWMGRRLWANVQASGLFDGAIFAYVLTNTEYESPYYGFERIQDFAHLIKQGILESTDYQKFLSDVEAMAAQNKYFYSITMYAYYGRSLSN